MGQRRKVALIGIILIVLGWAGLSNTSWLNEELGMGILTIHSLSIGAFIIGVIFLAYLLRSWLEGATGTSV